MKVFKGIIGVFAVIAGIYGLLFPEVSFLNAGLLIALVLLLLGICKLIAYFSAKKYKGTYKRIAGGGAFDLILAIGSIIFSLLYFFSEVGEALFYMIMLIVFTIYFFVGSINGIFRAVALKRTGAGGVWVLSLIISILLLIVAIIAICNVFVSAIVIGIMLAIMLMTFGVYLIASIFKPDESDLIEID